MSPGGRLGIRRASSLPSNCFFTLARIELKTVFAQLIPRFPSMHLMVGPTTLTVRRDVLAGGLVELPVSW
jgi:cytochrome P450